MATEHSTINFKKRFSFRTRPNKSDVYNSSNGEKFVKHNTSTYTCTFTRQTDPYDALSRTSITIKKRVLYIHRFHSSTVRHCSRLLTCRKHESISASQPLKPNYLSYPDHPQAVLFSLRKKASSHNEQPTHLPLYLLLSVSTPSFRLVGEIRRQTRSKKQDGSG